MGNYAVLGIFTGAIIGYLVELLVRFLPTGSLNTKCGLCGKDLNYDENRLFLKRCPSCGAKPAIRPLIIFVISMVGAILLGFNQSSPANVLLGWSILFFLLVIAFIDIEHHLILHSTTLFGLFFSAAAGTAIHGFKRSIVGGAIGLLFIGSFYIFGVFYAKYKSRKDKAGMEFEEALGFGDVTLATVLGMFLGHLEVFPALILGVFLAGGFSLVIVLKMVISKNYSSQIYIPYGPFLIIGAIAYLFYF